MLLQNEINGSVRLMHEAHARGLSIVFNPAPMDQGVQGYPPGWRTPCPARGP